MLATAKVAEDVVRASVDAEGESAVEGEVDVVESQVKATQTLRRMLPRRRRRRRLLCQLRQPVATHERVLAIAVRFAPSIWIPNHYSLPTRERSWRWLNKWGEAPGLFLRCRIPV